jgi:hypothetical protein
VPTINVRSLDRFHRRPAFYVFLPSTPHDKLAKIVSEFNGTMLGKDRPELSRVQCDVTMLKGTPELAGKEAS